MAVIDQANFSNVPWPSEQAEEAGSSNMPTDSNGQGNDVDEEHGQHMMGEEKLKCYVSQPIKENDGTKDAFISYLITTESTFPSFQKAVTTVRRRFTDFVFLYKSLSKDFPASAVPPIPDKQRIEYVRGDRFGSEFTSRRAKSLERFLCRCALHPVLRKAAILHTFLESAEWNATMRSRTSRAASSSSDAGSGGVFDNFADTFMNAFTKVYKPDKRFIEVKEKSDKLDDDLSHVEKVVARVARRETDLEADFRELAEQFQRLIVLEPGVEQACHAFVRSVEETANSLKKLKEVTDQDYLGSLRDMQAYSHALKTLLKAREQKQLDFEQLTEYLNKSMYERDSIQSGHHYGSSGGPLTGASGYIRARIEDVRGVDHEQSRRERQRKLELRIEELTAEVETAKSQSELFDDEVVKEVADFDRIKRHEFKRQLGGLADAHVDYYADVAQTWETYIKDMEAEGVVLPS